MKTLKISTLLVALASVFTFSSCLNDNGGGSSLPSYSSYVTITGDAVFGYTFHSDFGCRLKPTTASVEEVLPGLNNSKVKRAVVAFDLVDQNLQGQTLEAGKTYDIILRSSYNANYALPTYQTVDMTDDAMAADTLLNKNQNITSVNNYIWAINGYINAQMTVAYDPNKTFYLNTYYDRTTDIDRDNNTLYLNLYYNKNSNNDMHQGTAVFSFDLPDDAAFEFSQDTINVVLRATTNNVPMTEVGKCRMSINDFFVPGY